MRGPLLERHARARPRLRALRILFGVATSAAFLWLLLRGQDFEDVLRQVVAVHAADLALVALLLVLGHGLRIVRWTCMLRAFSSTVRFRDCCAPYLEGVALNNVAPLRAGDVYRGFALPRRGDLTRVHTFVTLVVERLLDLLTLLAFFGIGWSVRSASHVAATLAMWTGIAALSAVSLAIVLRIARRMAHTQTARTHPIAKRIVRIAADTRPLFRPGRASALVLASVASWTVTATVFTVIAAAFGAPGLPLASFFAVATANLAGLLPSSPGSIGTFHYFAAWGYAEFGLQWTRAAALALIVHAVLWIPLTTVGLGVLAWRHSFGNAWWLRARTGHRT